MMNGEFESMSALYATSPDFLPKPHAWGSYKSIPDTHFFLCDFHDMVEELPDITRFTKLVAELHLRSVSLSPNGKYGFHVTTYMGPLPQDNTWTDTWEEFFIRGIKRMLMLERAAQGPSPELDELVPKLYEKVIPRLLRPLEIGSNPIKPALIHGDLWYGNCCTDSSTDRPIVFDACSFWAHNECKCSTFLLATEHSYCQMKLGPGARYGIDLAENTSRHITSISQYLRHQKTTMIEAYCILCE
jgi:protein-ribulosamine 3-kinase